MRKKEVDKLTEVKVDEKIEKIGKVDITDEIKAGEAVSAKSITQTADAGRLVVALNFPRAISFVIRKDTPEEKTLTFYGNAEALRGEPSGVLPEAGTYGLTPDVDPEDWECLNREFSDSSLLRNGLLFASTPDKIRNEVAKKSNVRNGFEPIVFKDQQ